MTKQPLLDLFDQEYEFSTFITTNNEVVVANLQDFSTQFTHIYGEHLSGKTHLLKAWVNLANRRYNAGIYLTSDDLINISVHDIDLNTYRFIAIDDIDQSNDNQQIAIFDLFNLIKLNGLDNYLLTSSRVNLNHANLRIDLKTRIHSGVVFGLKNLSEESLIAALTIYTRREGIKFGEPEIKFLLTHYDRNLGQLLQLINQISLFATSNKKPITVHLIKQFTQ